jgi:bla regulator protein blaR1
MKRMIVPMAVAMFAACALFSQPAPLTFEVASIKPSPPDERHFMMQFQPGGGLRVTGVTLKMLITQAYDVREFQVSGGPGWINTERYDIVARPEHNADSDPSPEDPRKMSDEQRKTLGEQMRARLVALLADRFRLKVHRETQQALAYALVVGKNGPKLKQTEGASETRGRMRMGRGDLNGDGVKLEFLAQALANQLGRPVVDKTGLTGNYDIKLAWTPDPGPPAPLPLGPPPGLEPSPVPDPSGPSIFTAVEEQLGLRLESQKGPIETIVIDSVEKPSEN